MTIVRHLSLSLVAAMIVATAAPAFARPIDKAPRRAAIGSHEPARAFLKLEVGLPHATSRRLYVGQAVPIVIRAYFLGGTGVTMTGRPRLTSDGLQLSALAETPRQSQTELHGLPYTLLTWEGVLTAVRAGATKTDVELPVTLSYREPLRARSLDESEDDAATRGADDQQNGEDPFADLLRRSTLGSDPLFAQMFKGGDPFQGLFKGGDPLRRMFAELSGTVRQRDVTLRDAAGTLDVTALPADPPAGFTGAVGTFEIAAALDDQQPVRVGEPATWALKVRGRGSFARLSSTGLAASENLNAYRVTDSFTQGPTATTGEKIFKQTIVARRAGALMLPSVQVTYFDPDQGRYVSRNTTPITVSVAAGAGPLGKPPAAAMMPAAGSTPPGSPLAEPPMSRPPPDVTRTSLTPVIRTGWFWALAAGIGLASMIISTIGFLRRKGTLDRVATTRRLRREVQTHRRTLSAAADRGDATALFAAGRSALQARLGATWGMSSEAIAAVDVASRLGARGDRIRTIFERADRLAYSCGHAAPAEDLAPWRDVIMEELGALEVRS